MSYEVTKSLKSLVCSAAFAMSLGAISAPASAEMLKYVFVPATNASDLLSGYFYYNADDDSFGDIEISVDFGDGIGEHVITKDPTYWAAGSFTDTNPPFWSTGRTDVINALDTQWYSLWILASDLAGDTPIVGDIGTFRWEASWTSRDDAGRWIAPRPSVTDEDSLRVGNANNTYVSAFALAPVPEPSTYAMMAVGLLGIAGMRRRQNKA